MKHLRLQDARNEQEFYIEGKPAIFLSDIKYINIIVGPNNSRKSRFQRQIINLDFQVIFESPEDINSLYVNSQTIFEEIKEKSGRGLMDELAYLIFLETGKTSQIYKNIKACVVDQGGNTPPITFKKLKTNFDNINQALLSVGSETQFNSIIELITINYQTVSLLENIYNKVNDKSGDFIASPINSTNVEGINYTIQEVEGHFVPYYEVKLKTISNLKNYLKILKELKYEENVKSLIYIPVLRTSRMISGVTDSVFEKTILDHHFEKRPARLVVETGLQLYDRIVLARNGNIQQRKNFKAFEEFIGMAFFQSSDIEIVAHQTGKPNEKNIKISLPYERNDEIIHNIGDGIQGIINLLFPVFTSQDGSWIFIDEPENHLHPGFQNILINAIATNEFIIKKNLRFFINTHSNHILSESLMQSKSTEIFVFNRLNENSSQIRSFNGNEYYALEILGVLNTSVLISNCSIWVEGITDRLYLKAFLFAYYNSVKNIVKPIEGLHYTYIEYGGKNILHYNFRVDSVNPTEHEQDQIEAYFINSQVFLLADSDFDPEKRSIYKTIKRNNFVFFETEVPEIENILPDEILIGFLTDVICCDREEVLACFPIKEHNVKLGEYFTNKITYKGKPRLFAEQGKGGTLRYDYKKKLANYVYKQVVNNDIEWSVLQESELLKKLVTRLDEFIKKRNI